MNDLNIMAAPCQGKGVALYREECMWQNALDGRASDVCRINGVCTHTLHNSLYEHGDLQSCGLC